MNKYSPVQFNPKNHYKRHGLSDYMRAEKRHLSRMIAITAIALFVVAFGMAAYFDGQAVSLAIELGAR